MNQMKVIQNNKSDLQVKIPMLNLGKIVDDQDKEYYANLGSDDLDSITVTDDFLIDATGTYTSPLEDLKGIRTASGSFKNETTMPLN